MTLFFLTLSPVKQIVRLCLASIVILCHVNAHAASIIRDAELEGILREVTNPIFKAANVAPESVKLYIIQEPEINAFVSGGQNIFVNTGLLRLSEHPSMLIGVMAHETGHISGGHLVRSMDEYQNTAIKSTVGFLLGIAATAAGSPEAGQAIIAGTDHIARRQLLKYTRTQEEAADQAALKFLDNMNYSAKGLIDLLEILYNKENTLYANLNPYTLTHPLSRERIDHIKAHATPAGGNRILPTDLIHRYKLAIVKLKAFLGKPTDIINRYPASDKSEAARYARAIAYYRIPTIDKSLEEINSLIADYPKNPYYVELKGQILLENGKVADALPLYERAKNMLPQSALVKIELAGAYLATDNATYAPKAIENLRLALSKERDNSFLWHQLAVAYGRNKELGLSNLALAEKSLLYDNVEDAELFLSRAEGYIKPGSPADLQQQDLLVAIDRKKQELKRH